MTPEELARAFHEAYERLAPSFRYKTQEASAVPWEQVPEQNRKLMVAVAGEVLGDRLTALERENERLREALGHITSGYGPPTRAYTEAIARKALEGDKWKA